MGWAKYYEDNLEIMYERLAARGSLKEEAEIRLVCTSILPKKKIMVEINEDFFVSHNNQYKDKYIICKDCGRVFTFTANAQKHYAYKEWKEPKRCKCCRERQNIRHLMCPSF